VKDMQDDNRALVDFIYSDVTITTRFAANDEIAQIGIRGQNSTAMIISAQQFDLIA